MRTLREQLVRLHNSGDGCIGQRSRIQRDGHQLSGQRDQRLGNSDRKYLLSDHHHNTAGQPIRDYRQTATFSVTATSGHCHSVTSAEKQCEHRGSNFVDLHNSGNACIGQRSHIQRDGHQLSGQRDQRSATLTVSGSSAITITTQPASQSVTIGQTATFSVTATSGTLPLNYQWQKNNANIAGATLSTYTTPATLASDNGATFDVMVTTQRAA